MGDVRQVPGSGFWVPGFMVLSVAVVLCWIVMFLTGHDVWHDLGRPDVWNMTGPPYQDLRAFAVAFYFQFFLLLAQFALLAAQLGRGRRLPTTTETIEA